MTLPCLLTETFWIFSSRKTEDGAIPQVDFFVSGSKQWTKVSSAVTIQDKVCPSASKCANNTEKMALLSVLCCTVRNPFCTHLGISSILNDVTNASLPDWKTQCQFLGCGASILMNNGISMLQHFRTDSCDKMAWARCKVLLFSYLKAVTLLTQWPVVLQSTIAFP